MSKRVFVLDTNVLMHDPTALFRFQEHDIFIPMVVLEELDAGKKGVSEVARNVRQVSRFLDTLMARHTHAEIDAGLALDQGVEFAASADEDAPRASGRLYFETRPAEGSLPTMLPGNKADNSILLSALSLRGVFTGAEVVLVSKDINLRIKASVIGIEAEDYINDKVLEDLDLLYTGMPNCRAISGPRTARTWIPGRRRGAPSTRSAARKPDWHLNELLYFGRENDIELITRELDGDAATLDSPTTTAPARARSGG